MADLPLGFDDEHEAGWWGISAFVREDRESRVVFHLPTLLLAHFSASNGSRWVRWSEIDRELGQIRHVQKQDGSECSPGGGGGALAVLEYAIREWEGREGEAVPQIMVVNRMAAVNCKADMKVAVYQVATTSDGRATHAMRLLTRINYVSLSAMPPASCAVTWTRASVITLRDGYYCLASASD